MIVFFSENIANGLGELNAEDSKHCYKVLRKKVGDEISVLDGIGGIHSCQIEQIEKNKVSFKVNNSDYHDQKDFLPVIGISLLKNANRLEWFLEKGTEIGIHTIQPLLCDRTQKGKFRKDRAESIVKSAVKQSMNPYAPHIDEVKDLKDVIESANNDHRYICHYRPENDHLWDVLETGISPYILIGPEGDFTERELDKAAEHGWKQVNISRSRLRTETAALTACQIVNLKNRNE